MNKFIYKIIMFFVSIFAPASYISGPMAKILPEMTIEELLSLKPVYDSFQNCNFCCVLKMVDHTVLITLQGTEPEYNVSFSKDRLEQILEGFISELSQDYTSQEDLKVLPGHIDILRKAFNFALCHAAEILSITLQRSKEAEVVITIKTATVESTTQINFLQ